ncbi:MAG TPA: MFS transporter, partial [Gaiellaceae bacterium]|nr:MFS transporter [Gaiellaceae bacterium]
MTAAIRRVNARTFSSFRYRNYRLFFTGQAISQTGSWMQRIALGWFVYQLTHSAFAVGIMALASFLPFTVFGLFAGVLTDRLDARRTVIATQAGQLVTASALAWIAIAGIAQPWMLYVIAFVNGMVLVLDVPSRQQLTYRMVGREDLPNAIALNSSLFNASRIFGPAVAGMVYGFTGAGVCFLVNAISFLAVLLSLFAMRTREFYPLAEFERPEILRGTREGIAYVLRRRRMLVILALTVVLSTFCF